MCGDMLVVLAAQKTEAGGGLEPTRLRTTWTVGCNFSSKNKVLGPASWFDKCHLTTKTDNLNMIPRTHMIKGEPCLHIIL